MSNINVVIDMSNGLNEGITYTRDAAMKPILNKTLDKAHFYSVASANDVKELPFVSGKRKMLSFILQTRTTMVVHGLN